MYWVFNKRIRLSNKNPPILLLLPTGEKKRIIRKAIEAKLQKPWGVFINLWGEMLGKTSLGTPRENKKKKERESHKLSTTKKDHGLYPHFTIGKFGIDLWWHIKWVCVITSYKLISASSPLPNGTRLGWSIVLKKKWKKEYCKNIINAWLKIILHGIEILNTK